ncbi:type II toxin-antitoxin system HicB family antitoxin [Varunaivibrio sulfuroxidans]|uniref:Putative RNase H-like HicB family nuclease n=1 Tax=Varunaivibrio sulfuroxidans TaxID=1773489 RepID=A0A4R3J479_9PROT|nr:type II toxin-antitoxin system HicB family antitoxin [Varunaivibrio sulfuroxidans]TCS59964.1 putative RNase H-like HicB family nuclease [Varunaivibrio sulfuroxidans]WES31752.1 type II toxin-antitoxin system HicB family antitoxin [Varunaivibrio sulfuroxidans]
MAHYIALLRKEEESDFAVEFPDFPGCVTAGTTLDEAKDMAVEALALHIEGIREDGGGLPTPSRLETIMADPHNVGAVAFLVDAPAVKEKAVRVNFTILESVLRRVDAHAKAQHLTRSAFLAEAAIKAISDNEHV